ncbi:MAG: carbamate kinase [Paracoccaceae bacterium]|jgi:carbamate kinase
MGHDHAVATILTQVIVDPQDFVFDKLREFVGPIYEKADAEKHAKSGNWTIAKDGTARGCLVPSAKPVEIPDCGGFSGIEQLADALALLGGTASTRVARNETGPT